MYEKIRHRKSSVTVSQVLVDTAVMDDDAVFRKSDTCREGLSSAVAAIRLARSGPNVLSKDRRLTVATLIWHAFLNL